jgi:hypothetical protein
MLLDTTRSHWLRAANGHKKISRLANWLLLVNITSLSPAQFYLLHCLYAALWCVLAKFLFRF